MAVTRARNYHLLNRQRRRAVDSAGVRRFLAQLTSRMGRTDAAFVVVFVTDTAMRSFNRRYRGFDKPTDVLSFGGEGGYLGDILISVDTAWDQARRSRTLTFDTNIRRLALHGFLHLCGYNHETDRGEMRAIERRLRRLFQC